MAPRDASDRDGQTGNTCPHLGHEALSERPAPCEKLTPAQGQRPRIVMGLPIIDNEIPTEEMDKIVAAATDASNFLKAISHEGRLMILCHLATGEKSVTELEQLLSARQAAVSQQLSRLRLEGLVTPRREGKTIFYRLTDDRPRQIIDLVYDMFCASR